MYVWTKKAENRAKEVGLDERLEGSRASFGYDDQVPGSIARAWLSRGYIGIVGDHHETQEV